MKGYGPLEHTKYFREESLMQTPPSVSIEVKIKKRIEFIYNLTEWELTTSLGGAPSKSYTINIDIPISIDKSYICLKQV